MIIVNEKTYLSSEEKLLLLSEVKDIFYFHKKRYGSLRILEEMKEKGYEIGLYRIRSLMKEQGLRAIQPKQFVPRTTQSDPSLIRSPNLLLDTENLPTEPNQVIVRRYYLFTKRRAGLYSMAVPCYLDGFV